MAAPQGFDAATMPLTEEDTVMTDIGSGNGPSWSNEIQTSNADDERSNIGLPMDNVDDTVEESDDPPTTQGEAVGHHSPAWWDDDKFQGLLVVPGYSDQFLLAEAISERAYRHKYILPLSESCGTRPRTQRDVNKRKKFLEDNQTGIPRFLVRGFHDGSGGGVDPMLNGPHGVIPHAYLNGMDLMNIWTPDIFDMTTDHLVEQDDIESPFSSWTHFMATAREFSGNKASSMIAVLDTASVADRVWYSEDLFAAGLSEHGFDDEYLVHGPVGGPGYHCISVRRLVNTTRIEDINNGSTSAFGNERISLIEKEAVESSRQIAVALQPPGVGLENIVILTARFVGVRMCKFRGYLECLSYHDIHGFLYYARDDLQGLAMRTDAGDISLADQTMDTLYSQALEFEVQMQQAAENAVHLLARDLRAAMYSLLHY